MKIAAVGSPVSFIAEIELRVGKIEPRVAPTSKPGAVRPGNSALPEPGRLVPGADRRIPCYARHPLPAPADPTHPCRPRHCHLRQPNWSARACRCRQCHCHLRQPNLGHLRSRAARAMVTCASRTGATGCPFHRYLHQPNRRSLRCLRHRYLRQSYRDPQAATTVA
jgi:hypothetical protein